MDLGYFSTEGDHAAVVDDVNNGLLDVAAFASWCVFDAPIVHHVCIIDRDAVEGVLMASRKFKYGKFI